MSSLRGTPVPESLWSELDTATLLGSTAAPEPAAESALAELATTLGRWLGLIRSLGLAAAGAASGAVAGAGLALLLFLVFTVGLAPPRDTFARPLSLDFSQSDLVGQAVFLPEAQLRDGLLPDTAQHDARFLAPGQAVDVWAELEVARETGQGVAQVVAQLATVDGRVAAKASRALVMRSDWWSLSSLSLVPLRWLGLARDVRRVRVPLFSGYQEKRDLPFMVAHVSIKTRRPGWAAEVASAELKVQLRLGLVRRAIYTLRPGTLLALVLGGAAVAMMLGGGAAALLFLALLLYAGVSSRGSAASEGEAASVSGASGYEEVSSVSGVSDASSSLLRELDGEGTAHEGSPPSPHPAAAAAEHVERYLDTLPSRSAAAGQRAQRKAGEAAGPADSVASHAAAAAALRRRIGGAAKDL